MTTTELHETFFEEIKLIAEDKGFGYIKEAMGGGLTKLSAKVRFTTGFGFSTYNNLKVIGGYSAIIVFSEVENIVQPILVNNKLMGNVKAKDRNTFSPYLASDLHLKGIEMVKQLILPI